MDIDYWLADAPTMQKNLTLIGNWGGGKWRKRSWFKQKEEMWGGHGQGRFRGIGIENNNKKQD